MAHAIRERAQHPAERFARRDQLDLPGERAALHRRPPVLRPGGHRRRQNTGRSRLRSGAAVSDGTPQIGAPHASDSPTAAAIAMRTPV
ncbi:MAG: hypothetical protein R3F11_19785 [Verrucomicrobiales bacterium]